MPLPSEHLQQSYLVPAVGGRPVRSPPRIVLLLVAFVVLLASACSDAGEPTQGEREDALQSALVAYERGNYDKAFNIYMELAEQGNARAQAGIAGMYLKGKGVDSDIERAITWYEKAASKDWAPAQYELGHIYRTNDDLRDLDRAISYYREAAANGQPQAQYNLGVIYGKGIGRETDIEKAISYYKMAALQGDERAMYNLGVIYGQGNSIGRDVRRAYVWYYLSKESGYDKAAERVAWYNEHLNDEQVQALRGVAMEWQRENLQ